jgi:hypothetical protein
MNLYDLNIALRFLLEVCALVALGYWGFQTGRGLLLSFGLGIGAPLLAALAWGAFVSPQAQVPLPEPAKILLALVILGLGAAALAAVGRPTLAGVFGVLILINTILLYLWGQ